jgi:hypothetical protein
MNRKQYIRKIQAVQIAVYNSKESFYPDGFKLGDALKHSRDFAKEVPKKFGSYEAAWNSDIMKWCREHYNVW